MSKAKSSTIVRLILKTTLIINQTKSSTIFPISEKYN